MAGGLALTNATVRVLDPAGTVIASGKKVTAPSGAYGPITLTGNGTFRVEACGSMADRTLCVWGLTNNGGTLHLTPLSSAIAVLASGKAPEALMTGAQATLTDAALAAAQTQLATALSPALADAGLTSSADLQAGTLTPGSHSGLDRLLDTVGMSFGSDGKAYVSLASRLGSGVAYLEPGTTQGSIAFDAAAAGLDFTGIDTLYTGLAAGLIAGNCQTLLKPLMDSAARASLDTTTVTGADLTAQTLCLRVGGTFGDPTILPGGKLLPSLVNRCDFDGAAPLCRVNFVYLDSKGVQRTLGTEQAVVKRAGGWLFLGDRLGVRATATARLVLTRRVDNTAADSFARFLDIQIPVVGGLQCARVSQTDTSGNDALIAYFKKVGSATSLSLWSLSATDATPSLDPATGATRGANVFAVPLAGATGDAIARNLARAGRALKIAFYSDAACSTAAGVADGIADGSQISIDLAGAPPLASASLAGLPWPLLTAASATALGALKGAAAAKLSYTPSWTYSYAGTSMQKAQLCRDAACTQLVMEADVAPTAVTAALSATPTAATNAADFKQLRLTGRTADGLQLQLDAQSCSAKAAGQAC